MPLFVFYVLLQPMVDKHKIISFLIVLKRYRKNSVIFKEAKYKMAQKVGMSTNTFCKYLNQSLLLGHVTDQGDRYTLKKFEDVVREFCEVNNLHFNNHQILKRKSQLSFKETLAEFQEYLLLDNTLGRQEKAIKRKNDKIESYRKLRTVKRHAGGGCSKKDKELISSGQHRVENIYAHLNYRSSNVTSARHSGNAIGVSHQKANKILNSLKTATRNILVKWVHGISMFKIEQLRSRYPQATIIPLIQYNKIKVCFGSSIVGHVN